MAFAATFEMLVVNKCAQLILHRITRNVLQFIALWVSVLYIILMIEKEWYIENNKFSQLNVSIVVKY